MSTQNCIPLSRLSLELSDRYGNTPGYRKLYSMAQDGRLRTEMVNGRHYVPKTSLPAIAADLGLAPASHDSVPHTAVERAVA